ncbi:MAG: hypothetical protein LM600_08120 [Thaumarchaeota archaeon]|nr:hypothetical protein [Nitrososphaerota archaeon]
MTERVIDSSAQFSLKEEGSRNLRVVLLERPYALDLAVKEVANALWRRVLFVGDVDVEKAFKTLNDLIAMKGVPSEWSPKTFSCSKRLKWS